MSVEAVGWALRQRLPPLPKILLIALADQADERTGRVAYGRTDIEHLADKASLGRRSIFRYLKALERNAYLIRKSGRSEGRESAYWLCLGRRLSTDPKEFDWSCPQNEPEDVDGEPETQDVVGSANEAHPSEHRESEIAGTGGVTAAGTLIESRKHQNIRESGGLGESKSFQAQAQALEIESLNMERAAKQAGAQIFVIRNSRAWKAWEFYRRDVLKMQSFRMPVTSTTVRDRQQWGWWCPSLFPPKVAPPSDLAKEISDEDAAEFLRM